MVVIHVNVTVHESRLHSKFILRMEQYRNQRTYTFCDCIKGVPMEQYRNQRTYTFCDCIKGVRRRRIVVLKSWRLQI
jgi:hypothetical protein